MLHRWQSSASPPHHPDWPGTCWAPAHWPFARRPAFDSEQRCQPPACRQSSTACSTSCRDMSLVLCGAVQPATLLCQLPAPAAGQCRLTFTTSQQIQQPTLQSRWGRQLCRTVLCRVVLCRALQSASSGGSLAHFCAAVGFASCFCCWTKSQQLSNMISR